MAFIDGGSRALVLEKDTGRVRIVTGRTVTGTALDLAGGARFRARPAGHRALADVSRDNFVYLSYTRSTADGGAAFDNRVERYRGTARRSPSTADLTMPASPGPNHNGGKISFGRTESCTRSSAI
jgi:hypothetical protein